MTRMLNKEITDASDALCIWLDSQDIDPENAVPILTETLIGIVAAIADARGLDPKDAGEIIAGIIVEALS